MSCSAREGLSGGGLVFNIPFNIIWAVPCENVSLAQQRPRSACTSGQSDQSFLCPLTESMATTKCINGVQRPG